MTENQISLIIILGFFAVIAIADAIARRRP